jgi:hypothetical protein
MMAVMMKAIHTNEMIREEEGVTMILSARVAVMEVIHHEQPMCLEVDQMLLRRADRRRIEIAEMMLVIHIDEVTRE